MKKIVKEAITTYNEIRPHYSNYMLTPNQMHSQNLIKMRTYKTKTVVNMSLLLSKIVFLFFINPVSLFQD